MNKKASIQAREETTGVSLADITTALSVLDGNADMFRLLGTSVTFWCGLGDLAQTLAHAGTWMDVYLYLHSHVSDAMVELDAIPDTIVALVFEHVFFSHADSSTLQHELELFPMLLTLFPWWQQTIRQVYSRRAKAVLTDSESREYLTNIDRIVRHGKPEITKELVVAFDSAESPEDAARFLQHYSSSSQNCASLRNMLDKALPNVDAVRCCIENGSQVVSLDLLPLTRLRKLTIDHRCSAAFPELDSAPDLEYLALRACNQPLLLWYCPHSLQMTNLVELRMDGMYTDVHAAYLVAGLPKLQRLWWCADKDGDANLIHGYHKLAESGDIGKPIHQTLDFLQIALANEDEAGSIDYIDFCESDDGSSIDIYVAYEVAEFAVRIPSLQTLSNQVLPITNA
ncbi:hypothetical protein GQ54DRAFT_306117 [Martensiomyces pterosporus]|nr:hypothetical protein GQ54DRAFT_306117 [Martensiomyces pterosporus]